MTLLSLPPNMCGLSCLRTVLNSASIGQRSNVGVQPWAKLGRFGSQSSSRTLKLPNSGELEWVSNSSELASQHTIPCPKTQVGQERRGEGGSCPNVNSENQRK